MAMGTCFVVLIGYISMVASLEMHANVVFNSIKTNFHMSLEQEAYRTFDIIPVGYSFKKPSLSVLFPPYTLKSTTRMTQCDGMLNGIPVDPMRSMLEFTDSYDGCELIFPSDEQPKISKATIIVTSRYFNLEVQNETRFEYDFDIANMPDVTEEIFDWTSTYQVTPIRQPDGSMKFDVGFSMNGKATSPEFVSVDFEGVNLNSTSLEGANVAFYVDNNKTDPRASVVTKQTDKTISGTVSVAASLSEETAGIRGLLYISGAFKIGHYLKMKAGINAGRMIYKLYGQYYLFPFGKFGMLQPEVSTTINIEPNTFNIIPCKTIGASQYGFQYTPFLMKKSSATNDTWIRPKFENQRSILDLYVRESSGVIYNTSEDVAGMYACVLEFETGGGETTKNTSQTIRRMFNVVKKG